MDNSAFNSKMKFVPIFMLLILTIFGCEENSKSSSHRSVQDHEAWIDLRLDGFVAIDLEPIVTEIPKSLEVLEAVQLVVDEPIEKKKISCEWVKYTGTLIISYGVPESFQEREIANRIAQESLKLLGRLPHDIQSDPRILRWAEIDEGKK